MEIQGCGENAMKSGESQKHVRCPACGKKTTLNDNPFRPFCSRGCKGLDLIRWTSESYTIEGETDREETSDQSDT
ncbi:MAG: DNA gyrase inhibitor YacG [Desulfomonilia bacterium]